MRALQPGHQISGVCHSLVSLLSPIMSCAHLLWNLHTCDAGVLLITLLQSGGILELLNRSGRGRLELLTGV